MAGQGGERPLREPDGDVILVSGQALLLGLPHQISSSRLPFFRAPTLKDKFDKVLGVALDSRLSTLDSGLSTLSGSRPSTLNSIPMRACIQRTAGAQVTVDEKVIGKIGPGLVVLVGVAEGDQESDAFYLAEKIAQLRIFSDDRGKMNRSLVDVEGEMLIVSQFTLLGDCRKGRRPSFIQAARPESAERLMDRFCESVEGQGVSIATGQFAADMQVSLVNDGPVTLWIDTREGR